MKTFTALTTGVLLGLLSSANADQVFPDDVIVQGSLGVGMDAVNGENFSFDTVRLKENNLRIKFDDTSTSASFPSNDWQLTANDSTNGGANKFSIEDITGGRVPFTIEAAAPSNSLYVDDGGRIGVGTSTPVVEMHVVDGDSPTMRLEQDGSSGFTAQTWDVAGNETNFFVRDATNGSKLPFRIKTNAPNDSLFLDSDGDVGLGTQSPDADLHLTRNNGGTTFRMSNTVTTTGSSWDMTVKDDGGLLIQKEGRQEKYNLGGDGSIMITKPGGFGIQNIMSLDNTGNMIIAGALTDSSDVNRKEGFADVDSEMILDKLASIPVKYWRYKGDDVTHMGPMAQDFYSRFEIGLGETTISKPDADGVAFASIQALYRKSLQKDDEITSLKEKNVALEQRLQKLERMFNESK